MNSQKGFELGLLEQQGEKATGTIRATHKGFDFLNNCQALFLSACSEEASEKAQTTKSTTTVNSAEKTASTTKIKPSGKAIFEQNCLVCHGKAGQGLFKDWKRRQPDGKFPAPPLNGTAHTWHHSPKLLLQTIDNGGVKFGGTMLGFKGQLTDAEKQAILDYLYSLWPQDIQQKYSARFK